MDVATAISLGIASWGAILSTVLAAQQLRDRRPHVRVLLSLGAMVIVQTEPEVVARIVVGEQSDGSAPREVIISVQNVGQVNVTLGRVGFVLPNGRAYDLMAEPNKSTHSLPHLLAPSEMFSVWPTADEVARYLISNGFRGNVRLVAYVGDHLSHKYRSKPLVFETGNGIEDGTLPHPK